MTEKKSVQSRQTLQHITPYSPGKPIWELQKEMGLTEVIKLASNENPLGPSPKAVEAIASALQDLNRYPDAGTFELRETIAANRNVIPDQIIITNGGDELITLISEAFLDPDDQLIVQTPTFSEYEFGARLMSAQVLSVPFKSDFSFDIDAVLAAVNENTKLISLCSPNNPTGAYLPKNELKRLLDNLPPQVLVLYDAAYSQFAANAQDYSDGLEFVREGYPIVVLQTFSKIYGIAGVRVGYGIGPISIIQQILKVKEPFNVNALAQAGAIAAIGDVEHLEKTVASNQAGREQLYAAFKRLGLNYTPSSSNFILVSLGANAKQHYDALLSKGVIVRYGAMWGLPAYIRVSVGTENENAIFIRALDEILSESK